VLGVYVYSTVDAYRLARRWATVYEPREYNRPVVYVLFILVGVTYPAAVLPSLRANAFEAFIIAAASEVPSLLLGDRVLANKAALGARALQRGDVVVFRAPNDRQVQFAKRVIALPGDTIEIRSGRVHVNNKALELDPIPDSSAAPGDARHEGRVFAESNAGHRYRILLPSSEPLEDYAPHTVPQNTCFVLGDNRNRSRDSRHFGFVPLGDLVGVIQYIYFPADTWSRFGAFRD
jgi:signal peptidase I